MLGWVGTHTYYQHTRKPLRDQESSLAPVYSSPLKRTPVALLPSKWFPKIPYLESKAFFNEFHHLKIKQKVT